MRLLGLFLFLITAFPAFSQTERIELPKLLTTDFIKLSDICEDAKNREPSKKFALVSIRAHECDEPKNPDFKGQACMAEARDFADPKNAFVKDNFVLYSFRLGSHDDKGDFNFSQDLRQAFFDHWYPITNELAKNEKYKEASD